jgi:hypothetical protein
MEPASGAACHADTLICPCCRRRCPCRLLSTLLLLLLVVLLLLLVVAGTGAPGIVGGACHRHCVAALAPALAACPAATCRRVRAACKGAAGGAGAGLRAAVSPTGRRDRCNARVPTDGGGTGDMVSGGGWGGQPCVLVELAVVHRPSTMCFQAVGGGQT